MSHRADVPPKELPQAAADASILVVRSKQVTAEVFDQATTLSLVVRAGAGVNTIDVPAASRRGVYVANCPGQNSIAVAELAIGLVLALDRRIPDNVALLRAGKWDKKRFGEADGLFGRTLGVAGLGAIGREVVKRAQALGMRVVAWSRSLDDAGAKALGVERAADLLALARASDFLSLHLPLTKETRGAVSRAVLEALRPGAALVNTARAEVVDQEALLELATARADPRRDRRLRGRAGEGPGRLRQPAREAAERLRHPPHRRLHRAGAGGDRAGGGAHRGGVRARGAGAELRERREADARAGAARRAPPRQGGRARERARRDPRGGHQRAGGPEHGLRGGAGGELRHRPRRAAARPAGRPIRASDDVLFVGAFEV